MVYIEKYKNASLLYDAILLNAPLVYIIYKSHHKTKVSEQNTQILQYREKITKLNLRLNIKSRENQILSEKRKKPELETKNISTMALRWDIKSRQPNFVYDKIIYYKDDYLLTDLIYTRKASQDIWSQQCEEYENDLKELNTLEEKQELKDPLYIPPKENIEVKIGVFLEEFLCINLKCPVCKKDNLMKCALVYQQIVDLYCPNDHGDNGINFFQVKSRRDISINKYFDVSLDGAKSSYITVGSYNYGKHVHEIKYNEKHYRHIAIGYICIVYNYDEHHYNIKIDTTDSYTIIPNFCSLFELSPISINNQFYIYEYHHDSTTSHKIILNKTKLIISNLHGKIISDTVIFDENLFSKYGWTTPEKLKPIIPE